MSRDLLVAPAPYLFSQGLLEKNLVGGIEEYFPIRATESRQRNRQKGARRAQVWEA